MTAASVLFERVRAIPVESVIREYFPSLELSHSGRDLIAVCPFHAEKTASFKIDIEKNRWHCFGACAKSGSVIDLLLTGELASSPLDAAKALAVKFGIDTGDEKPKRQGQALTVGQYAEFCALYETFLRETFSLANSESGVEIPYKDESGAVISVQRRHRLEKAKTKDGRFSWRKGDKPIPYGLWLLPSEKSRLFVVEGASDVHVLAHSGLTALGIPGASNFKPEMVTVLLPFAEVVLIQEPGQAGENFAAGIVRILRESNYKGIVRAVVLSEKDPRALWSTSKDRAQFVAALDQSTTATLPLDLYPEVPRTADLIFQIRSLLTRHLFFKNPRLPLLIAIWILGTYVYQSFTVFGYLWANSAEKRSGKSRLLELLEKLTSNATPRLSNVNVATIFRLANKQQTLILDELENLKGEDKEAYQGVIQLLNTGFQAGAKVARCLKVEGEWDVGYFECFCPKAFASIKGLPDTIEDRSFKILMTRKSASERVERFNLRRQGKELEALRSALTVWAEARSQDIQGVYDGLSEVPDLKGLDDRFQDIAEPLVAIALIADAELSNGTQRIWPDLSDILRDMAGQRPDADRSDALTGLITIAENVLDGAVDSFISNNELLKRAVATDGLTWLKSTKGLATFCGKYSLVPRHNSAKTERGYLITKEWVDDIRARYLPPIVDFKPSEPSGNQAGRGFEGIL